MGIFYRVPAATFSLVCAHFLLDSFHHHDMVASVGAVGRDTEEHNAGQTWLPKLGEIGA